MEAVHTPEVCSAPESSARVMVLRRFTRVVEEKRALELCNEAPEIASDLCGVVVRP